MTSATKKFITSPGFTTQPLSQVAKGAAQSVSGTASKAARLMSSPAALGLAGGVGAMKGFQTDTEQYAKRFGLEHTEPGLARDLGVRALGVASDVGDALTLGLASRLYRDTDQSGGSVFNAVLPHVTPANSNHSPLQADPSSPRLKDPANPANPVNPGAAQAMPSAAQQLSAQQIAPNIYRQGNSYSDTADGAAAGARPAPISAQNMAAANALAQRYSNPLVQAAQQPQQPQGSQVFIGADTGGYGLLDKGRIERRNAMMDAQQLKPGARTALAALLQQQGAEPGRALEREKMAQQGQESAADRSMKRWTFAEHIRDAEEQRRLKEAELRGNSLVDAAKIRALDMDTEAASQLAQLRGDFLQASNEEDRRNAAEKLGTLMGRPSVDDYITVRGGSRYDPVAMAVVNEPDILVSRATGRAVNFNGDTNEVIQLVPGRVYQRTDGKGKPLNARYLGNGKWQSVD